MQWLEIEGYINGKDLISVLPPSLTHLRYGSGSHPFDESELPSLKLAVPNLTHLDIFVGSPIPFSAVNSLSPSLKYISLSEISWSRPKPDSQDPIVSLPPNATFFKLPQIWGHELTQKELVGAIGQLPSSLTSLSLVGGVAMGTWTLPALLSLPRSLTSLEISLSESSLLKCLPKNLTKLKLGNYKGRPKPPTSEGLTHLPASLTALDLFFVSNPPFRQGWARHLTRLTTLTACGHVTLEPRDLQELPPSLTVLHLNQVQAPTKGVSFPGKQAWMTAMSHFEGFSLFAIRGHFSDADMLYGLKNNLNPLKQLVLQRIDQGNPLTDEHMAFPNLKLLLDLHITGASICTEKVLEVLPKPPTFIHFPISPHISTSSAAADGIMWEEEEEETE
jgi:hypothetical protein